jgi:hypothetical protein
MPSVTMNGGIFVRDTKARSRHKGAADEPSDRRSSESPKRAANNAKVSAKKNDRRNRHGDEGADRQIESPADDDQGLAERHEAKGGGARDNQDQIRGSYEHAA